MMLSVAGSRVSVAITATMTTDIAPMPRLTKTLCGTTSSPIRANTTVTPLKKTARVAVEPAMAIASILSWPRCRSSRKRETMNRA